MSENETTIKDNEQVYDEKIAPLMTQIIEICREREIPFVASFQYAPEHLGTTVIGEQGQAKRLGMEADVLVRGHTAFAVTGRGE